VDAWFANVSYGYRNPSSFRPSRSSNSLQVNAGFGLWNNRLAIHGEVGADLTEKQFLSRSLGLTWNDDCFSVGVDYKYFSEVIRVNGKEGQITFSISLPNIGSLVNYQSGATPRRF
jgi:lipopolysaccharide assembly outer membrane protein LptD (OstA)